MMWPMTHLSSRWQWALEVADDALELEVAVGALEVADDALEVAVVGVSGGC